MICLINGKINNTVYALDRGLQFGDGCFTTIRIVKNQVALLDYHIYRLQQCTKKLFLPNINWKNIASDIKTLALLNKQELAVIKVIITRGTGYNRGYSTIGFNKSTIIIVLTKYPQYYIHQQKNGINLIISTLPVYQKFHLNGIKHLNCLEYIFIKKQIEIMKADEALVTDINGIIIGCCAANIFWRKNNYIYTPDLNNIGIKGIMRKKIINSLLNNSQFKLIYINAKLSTLHNCDEIIISNSLMPILPVNFIRTQTNNIGYHYKSKKLFQFLKPYCHMLR